MYVCMFVLVVLLLHGHVWGSIRVHLRNRQIMATTRYKEIYIFLHNKLRRKIRNERNENVWTRPNLTIPFPVQNGNCSVQNKMNYSYFELEKVENRKKNYIYKKKGDKSEKRKTIRTFKKKQQLTIRTAEENLST